MVDLVEIVRHSGDNPVYCEACGQALVLDVQFSGFSRSTGVGTGEEILYCPASTLVERVATALCGYSYACCYRWVVGDQKWRETWAPDESDDRRHARSA